MVFPLSLFSIHADVNNNEHHAMTFNNIYASTVFHGSNGTTSSMMIILDIEQSDILRSNGPSDNVKIVMPA